MKKDVIIAVFDKATGISDGWADFAEMEAIRSDFIRLLSEVGEIEMKCFLGRISKKGLEAIDKEINNEKSS